MLIFSLLSLLGLSWFLSHKTRWSPEQSLFFVILAVVSGLYLGALAGLLSIMAGALLALGLIALVLMSIWRAEAKPFFTPAVCLFVFSFALIALRLFFFHFANWDEFSHWGLVSKAIYAAKALPDAGTAIFFKDYPTATALFHFFFMQGGSYREGIAYIAQALLVWSPLLLLLQGLNWQRKGLLLGVAATFYTLIFVFSPGLANLQVDATVGLLFGAGVISYLSEKQLRTAAIRLVPLLFCLPLIKTVGALLAGTLVLIVIVNELAKRTPIKKVFLLLLLVLPILAAKQSWQWHMQTINAAPVFKLSATDPLKKTVRTKTTLHNFGQALLHKRVGAGGHIKPNMPVVFWLLLIVLASAIIVYWQREHRRDFIATSIGFFIGFVIFTAGLLWLYLFSFGAYEGVRLASFGRYMGIYFIAWWLFIIHSLRNCLLQYEKLPTKQVELVALLPIFFLHLSLRPSAGFFVKQLVQSDSRQSVTQIAEQVRDSVPTNGKIFIVWQKSRGFETYQFAYDLHPMHVNDWCWSVTRSSKHDVWTCQLSSQGFLDKLKGYDYLLLAKTDALFWQGFGRVLPRIAHPNQAHLLQLVKGRVQRVVF